MMFAPGRQRAGQGRLAGDARPGAYPHAALRARHAGHGGAAAGRVPQSGGPGLRASRGDARVVSRAFRPAGGLAGRPRGRRTAWWKSSNIGWSRHDPRGNRRREAADRVAQRAGGEGHRLAGRDRRAHRQHRQRQSRPGRAHGGEGVDRSGVSRAAAGGRVEGGRGTRHSDARHAAAGRAGGQRRTLHHLVVCTLCSCYPRAVLGYPPFWYKSAGYRARAVRDPRGLLAEEWGTVLPDTSGCAWSIPPRIIAGWCCRCAPPGRRGGTRQRLASIVREGDMIGVTLPHVQSISTAT